jgi:uncharacterized protein (TIRG00374 family)
MKPIEKDTLILAINGLSSIVLIVVVLYFSGLQDVIKTLSEINLWYLLLSMFFLLLMDLGMSFRIKILLEELGQKVRFFDIIKSHFVGMLTADFTPARAGYFSTAAVLHYKYDVASEKAMISIFGPQIFDFVLKLVAGTAAVIYVLYRFIPPEKGWIIIIGSVVMFVTVFLMILMLFSERFLRLFHFFGRIPLCSKIYMMFERMQKNSYIIIKKTPMIIALLFFTWSAKAISWYFVAKAVGITISGFEFPEIVFYFFLQPLLTMLEFMPSPTIAGLGLSEGGSVLVYSFFGVMAAPASAFALLARFKTTAVHLPAVPEAIEALKKGKERI